MQLRSYGAVLALLAAAPLAAQAQKTAALPATPAATATAPAITLPPLVDSRQAITQAVTLYDQGDYTGAIALHRSITPGDTLYAAAQSELATSYIALEKYQEAVEAASRALAQPYHDPQPYIALSWAEEELKHPEKAQAAYDTGLKYFPYNQSLWFNQGVFQVATRQFAPGFASLQRGVTLKPTHPNSHYQLAYVASRQGHTSHAMLSMLTYLLLQPAASSHNMLVALEQQAARTAVLEEADKIAPFTPNTAFQELDALLDSKIALRKDYVSKVKFDAALVKQLQLLVEKFPATPSATADDFWLRLYGPLVAQLRLNDNLTTATYLALASADDKKAAQWIKGNKSRIEKFYTAVSPALLQIREQQPFVHDGKPVLAKGWFDDNGTLNGIGEGTVEGEERRFTGPWLFVDENGASQQQGLYSADFKRTGPWRLYYPTGVLERTATYRNGELDGLVRDYHDNGQPAVEATYVNGKTEGVLKVFSYCGELSETRTFRAGDLNGSYRELYPDGKTKMQVEMRADKQEGVKTYFYPDGIKEYEYTYLDGKKLGAFLVNYADGTPEKRGSYDQDELHGPYTEYFSNRQLQNTGTYTHGKQTGVWKSYFADGRISDERSFDEAGELHGTFRDYNYQGKLYSEVEYEHGRITRQRYFDPATVSRLQDTPVPKKGRVAVQLYGVEAGISGTGAYVDGFMEGEWRWNYSNGLLQQIRHYKQGQQQGPALEYYANGQLKQRTSYESGQLAGSFESFLRDGQRYQTGYYRAGQQQGLWREFYADGQVSEEYEMHQGQKNGPTRSFAPNGKLTESRVYGFGRKLQLTTYDTLGRAVSHVALRPDTKEFTFTFPGGQPHYRTQVACYENRGPARWYHPNGQPEVEFSYEADQRHGPYKAYFSGGKLRQEGVFRNGEQHGEWKDYYPSGQVRFVRSYRYGSLDGEARHYFANGQLETVQTYLYSTVEGPSRYYNPAGELLEENLYEHGALVAFRGGANPTQPWQQLEKMAGPMNTTFANGKPAASQTVRGGVIDGVRTSYYSSGQVFRRMTFQDGLLTGPLTSFYADGKLMEEEGYLHGELHGRSRYYRPDGTLERTETYRSGEKLGPTVYYDAKGKPTKTEVYWNNYVYEGK